MQIQFCNVNSSHTEQAANNTTVTYFPFPNQFPTHATTAGQPVVCTSPFKACKRKTTSVISILLSTWVWHVEANYSAWFGHVLSVWLTPTWLKIYYGPERLKYNRLRKEKMLSMMYTCQVCTDKIVIWFYLKVLLISLWILIPNKKRAIGKELLLFFWFHIV